MLDESTEELTLSEAETAALYAAKWWGWTSVAAFVVSLITPAFCLIDRCVPGWEALAMGWMHVVFQPRVGLSWFATPALMLTWLCLQGSGRAATLFAASLTLALQVPFLFVRGVMTGEDGFAHPVLVYHVGYWAWVASPVLAIVAATCLPKRSKVDSPTAD